MLRIQRNVTISYPRLVRVIARYGSHSSLSEGPVGIYKSYLDRNILRPDKRQHQAVVKLQDLYDRVKDYKPKELNQGNIYIQ